MKMIMKNISYRHIDIYPELHTYNKYKKCPNDV